MNGIYSGKKRTKLLVRAQTDGNQPLAPSLTAVLLHRRVDVGRDQTRSHSDNISHLDDGSKR
jgi:hypothetical protein